MRFEPLAWGLPSMRRMESSPIQSYRDLDAWQLGMQLVEQVYRLTRQLPSNETYGLAAQLRRTAVGIPSNVAEGQQYGFGRNYARFVSIALGCEAELQTQLEVVKRLGLAKGEHVQPVLDLASRTGQVLRGLKRTIVRGAPRSAHEEK